MRGWWWRLLDGLFPARCVGCAGPGQWWCDGCDAQVVLIRQPNCPRCRAMTSRGEYCRRCRPHMRLTGILAGARGREPLLTAIKSLKYRHAAVLVPVLTRYLVIALARGELRGRPILVPVPLHPARLRQRGYNQAGLLAAKVRAASGLELREELIRTRRTRSQTGLTKADRQINVADAFRWRGTSLQGKTILLVDDIATTGATLDACAAALREAGARQVWGLVVAQR